MAAEPTVVATQRDDDDIALPDIPDVDDDAEDVEGLTEEEEAAPSQPPAAAQMVQRVLDRAALRERFTALHEVLLRRPGGDWLLAAGPRHLPVYAGTAVAFLITAAPFVLASAEGFTPGFDGIPSPGVWDSPGRALAIAREGLLPVTLSDGPDSPLWTWVLTIVNVLTGWTGLSIATSAKILGWLCGVVGALALYNIALRLTGSRWPGILALGLLAVDPALAFGRFAGGAAPLAFALAALSVLALVQSRYRPLAWLLAAATLARPDGYLIALAIGALLAADTLWDGGKLEARADRLVVGLARLLAPSGIALALWGAFRLVGWTAAAPALDGSVERSLLATARAIWSGWLAPHPAIGSLFVVITLAALGWLALHAMRHWSVRGLAVIVVPLLYVYSLATTAELPAAGWNYDVRRIGEPALPWLALALGVGLAAAGDFVWRSTRASLPPALQRLHDMPLGRAFAFVPLTLWALTAALLWIRLPTDFAFGARNVAEAPLAAGAWIAANAPTAVRIGLESGAEPVRGTARRETRDLPRPMTTIAPSAYRDALRDLGLTHLAVFRGSPYAAWPNALEIAKAASGRNVALPAPEIVVFAIDWGVSRVDPGQPVWLRIPGYRVLDRFDVGDPTSETAHFYASAASGAPVYAEAPVPAGWIEDHGRVQDLGRGAEGFSLASQPGRDLLVGVRYDGPSRGALRVDVERQSFELRLRECPIPLCEDLLLVPGELVRSNQLRLTVSFVPAPGAQSGRIGTYHYWAIVRE